MANFNFRLQPVLNIKIQKEDHLKNELGKAIRKLEDEKRRLELFENELKNTVEKFNEKSKKTTVQSLIEFNGYISLLNYQIRRQKENVNKAARIADKVREELVEALKERQILDRYREKKLLEFEMEQKKLEQNANDEIVSYRHQNSGD